MATYNINKIQLPNGDVCNTNAEIIKLSNQESNFIISGPFPWNMPAGGTSGQVLTKVSASNYDAAWANVGDGTFESLETNVNAGTGTVKIQRYGKMRFLFVDFKPSITGVNLLVAELDPSDAPSEDFYIGVSSYNGDKTCVFHVYSNGSIAMDLATNPNDYLRGTAAFMVP